MTFAQKSRALPLLALLAAAPVFAEPPQGRPVVTLPVGPNISQAAPDTAVTSGDGVVYERQRIKRTVSLDPAQGVDGKWDTLFAVQDGAVGLRTTYFDWDDNFVYLAVETPAPVEARIDLDGANDGWLRGADNLSLRIAPPPADGQSARVTAQRFDLAQSKEYPVWAGSPIPVETIKATGGRTPRGTYALLIALPRTEQMGLNRKPGESLGLRVETAQTLPDNAGEVVSVPVRPMLRLELSEAVGASDGPLTFQVSISGARQIVPGGEVKATLEVRNSGTTPQRLARVFLRGSQNAADFLDDRKFAGMDIAPGKTEKWELRSSVAPAAPFGAIVLTGGGDLENGTTIAALAAFDKTEPYSVRLDAEDKPVPGNQATGQPEKRTARVFIISHSNQRITAQVTLKLPTGWKFDEGGADRKIALVRDGQEEAARYKVVIPPGTAPGKYELSAQVEAGGRSYTATDLILVVP